MKSTARGDEDRAVTQYDIYANPSKAQRREIPWIVDVQSDLLSKLPTRLVIPLALRETMPQAMPGALCPEVRWEGDSLVALPYLAAPFRVRDLGTPTGNLRSLASELVASIDAVISGI